MANEKRLIDANAKMIDKYFNKRLIDVNEILRFLENEIDKYVGALNKWEKDYVKAVRVAVKIIRCFPTVDAVEVVRCKDCKWWKKKGLCPMPNYNGEAFCSYGERKDNA